MGKIHNEITINAGPGKIWEILATPGMLDKYDPTVKKSTLISNEKTGLGAKRKVEMRDDKNWFEEKITEFEPGKILTYQLTACSFPVKALKHTYTFEVHGNRTRVHQVMEYTVKFGLLGKLMDALMIKKQSDGGIKMFFKGLKEFAESQAG